MVKLGFIEEKVPDFARVEALLGLCVRQNQWANGGPLVAMLRDLYAAHFGLSDSVTLTPCSSGGTALAAMARLHEVRLGRPLRWVGSAFSFKNLGRGDFAGMMFLDCDENGLLDLDALARLDPDSFDGIVLVNPHGYYRDFSAYTAFAEKTGKALLIDNAAGIDAGIPDWPWQAFSLHQTKPYGVGEGGLALTPAEDAADLLDLVRYGPAPASPAAWLGNGKMSDIAAAYLIDRLERAPDWRPRYLEQAERVVGIARAAGLRPLSPQLCPGPLTSWPFVAPVPLPLERVVAAPRVTFGKYYDPLADRPRARHLYERLLNIPTHSGMARLADAELANELQALLDVSSARQRAG